MENQSLFFGLYLLDHARMNHVLGIEYHVKLLFGQQVALQNEVVDALSALQGFLCDLGAVGVSDVGLEGCHDADAVLNLFLAVLPVGLDALDTFDAEGAEGAAHPCGGLYERLDHHGLHYVELELGGLGSHGHCEVIADNLEADLVDHLGDDRIDLAGHDGRTGLLGRQLDLLDTGAGAG